MLQKLMLVATAIAGLTAIGAQAAAAEWYDKGVALKSGQNPEISLTGTASFTSPNGGVHCNNAIATVQGTGGTTKGHLNAFNSENPAACEVTGGLVFLTGGTTTVKQCTYTVSAASIVVIISPNRFDISGFFLHIHFTNGFKLTLESETNPLTATPDNATSITSVSLGGTLKSGIGNVAVSGTMNVLAPNSGTYGIVS